jgi:hypothetical protein
MTNCFKKVGFRSSEVNVNQYETVPSQEMEVLQQLLMDSGNENLQCTKYVQIDSEVVASPKSAELADTVQELESEAASIDSSDEEHDEEITETVISTAEARECARKLKQHMLSKMGAVGFTHLSEF